MKLGIITSRFTFVALLLVGAAACGSTYTGPRDKTPGTDPPPKTPAAAVDDDNRKACAVLERVGCPEAKPKAGAMACVDAFAQAEGEHLAVRYDCYLAPATTTPEAVRACGGPGYFTVRCRTDLK